MCPVLKNLKFKCEFSWLELSCLQSSLLPFVFCLESGLRLRGKSTWFVRQGSSPGYLPLVVWASGTGPRNVTDKISTWNLFDAPTPLKLTKMPVTPTNLGFFGLGMGLCFHPSGIVPLQKNAIFWFRKLIHWALSISNDLVSSTILLGRPVTLTKGGYLADMSLAGDSCVRLVSLKRKM